jgi:hypothetical protein
MVGTDRRLRAVRVVKLVEQGQAQDDTQQDRDHGIGTDAVA